MNIHHTGETLSEVEITSFRDLLTTKAAVKEQLAAIQERPDASLATVAVLSQLETSLEAHVAEIPDEADAANYKGPKFDAIVYDGDDGTVLLGALSWLSSQRYDKSHDTPRGFEWIYGKNAKSSAQSHRAEDASNMIEEMGLNTDTGALRAIASKVDTQALQPARRR